LKILLRPICAGICSFHDDPSIGISVIWNMERWSILRQTATHFVICSAITLPVAYFMQWIEQSLAGVLIYYGFFAAVYVVIWLSVYFATRKKIMKVNEAIKNIAAE